MNKRTYEFHGASGVVPDLTGYTFPAESWVTVDLDSMTILEQGMISDAQPSDPGSQRVVRIATGQTASALSWQAF